MPGDIARPTPPTPPETPSVRRPRNTHQDRVLGVLRPHLTLTLSEIARRARLSESQTWSALVRLMQRGRIMASMDRYCRVNRGIRPSYKQCYFVSHAA